MPELATDVLPIGRTPRPATGDDLAERVRAALAASAPGAVDPSPLRVSATLDAADVPTLDIELSGLILRDLPREASPRPAALEVARREAGTVGRLRVDAHPVTVEGVPVDVHAEAAGVPFAWVEGPDGSLAIEVVEPAPGADVAGTLRVAAPRAELVAAVQRVAERAVTRHGVALGRLDVDLVSRGPRTVDVRASAQVRKGFLSAGVEARATVEVDAALVLTVRDVSLASGNPLVAAFVGAARGRLRAIEGRRIDLRASLPSGVRLTDIRVDVGDDIVVSARVG